MPRFARKFAALFVVSVIAVLIAAPFALAADEENKPDPQSNPLCWRKEACEFKDDEGNATGIFDNKCEKCVESCGGGMGFCFPIPQTVNIGVAIPDQEGKIIEVKDIGSYINLVYKYLLGVSTMIAIVMVMVGGLQWVLAAGSLGQINSAKTRITNAITGLLLLLFAHLLLATVNPDLVNLKPIRLPKMRPVVLLDKETTCEWYLGLLGDENKEAIVKQFQLPSFKGFTVEPDISTPGKITDTCGKKDSKVTKDPWGAPIQDTTCTWGGCAEAQIPGTTAKVYKSCLEKGDQTRICAGCWEVGEHFGLAGLEPSSDTCGALNNPTNFVPNAKQDIQCIFDGYFEYRGVAIGGCITQVVDCNLVKSCEDYFKDGARVAGSDLTPSTGTLYWYGQLGINTEQRAAKVCTDNKCALPGGCKYTDKILTGLLGDTCTPNK